MASISFSEASLDDLVHFSRIIRLSYKYLSDEIPEDYITLSFSEVRNALNQKDRINKFMYYEEQQIGVYSCKFYSNVMHLSMFHLIPEFHGKGFGAKLLDDVKRTAKKSDFSLITANVQSWAVWAQHFYEKHGFIKFKPEHEILNEKLKSYINLRKHIGKLNDGYKLLYWHLMS